MRQPLLVTMLVVACATPALAQKKAAPAPAAKSAAPAAKAAAAPAGQQVDLNVVAAKAGLDAKAKARVAPHVAAMNAELAQLHTLTASARKDAPKAEQDKLHQALNAHFQSFDKHWTEATEGMSAQQKAAFDAAVKQQMGVRAAPVGNPHSKLPAKHPQVDKNGFPVKK